MKLIWLTDTHLSFIKKPELWWKKVLEENPEGSFLVTGDITESQHIDDTLRMFATAKRPVYFILGNHDYYGSSIEKVRKELSDLDNHRAGEYVKYLNNENVIPLTDNSVLVGDDGWYDGRNGKYFKSTVALNDFYYVKEFKGLDRHGRLRVMMKYADASAARVQGLCEIASKQAGLKHIYVATHVPPFAGAAWHLGEISDWQFQPFFSSQIMGEAIVAGTKEFRAAGGQVTVLCGHSHSEGIINPEENLECLTGKADYGRPAVYKTLEIV